MPGILCVSRTRSHECSERLEPDIRERIRPVLRGGGNGNAVSLLDTMRMTVLGQYIKGLIRLDREVGEGIQKKLESVKWLLWHGKVDKALARLADLNWHLDYFTDTYPRFPRLKKAVRKFRTYIENNRAFIPNYGKRYRNGETISTAFVESTVNYVLSKRFVKRQSMQWTKRGAHLLLQTRVKTLNNELPATFRRWYPDFQVEETAPLAA
jgi:hypothetical protein